MLILQLSMTLRLLAQIGCAFNGLQTASHHSHPTTMGAFIYLMAACYGLALAPTHFASSDSDVGGVIERHGKGLT